MEKTLQILGLLAIVGSAAIVGAQVHSHGGTAVTLGGHTVRSGEAVSTGMAQMIDARDRTALQDAILSYFINRQNHAIEVAREKGQEDVVAAVIKMNCYHVLTMMDPSQQRREINQVWQVNRFVPNDQGWKAVTQAPSLANEILKLSPTTEKAVRAEMQKQRKLGASQTQRMITELLARPGFKDLSKQEQHRIIFEESKKLEAGRPKTTAAQRYEKAAERALAVLEALRPVLTKAQAREMDGFVDRYHADLNLVTSGRKPVFLSK